MRRAGAFFNHRICLVAGAYCIYSFFREGVPVELLVFSALTLLSGRVIIDTLLQTYEPHMPAAEEAAHPIGRTIGEARGSLIEVHDSITAARYTAGVHVVVAGWSAANRRLVLHAHPARDLDRRGAEGRRLARAA